MTQQRYALAVMDDDAGLIFSVGGVWSYHAADDGELMTGAQADAMHASHPRATIVDMIVWRAICAAHAAGFRTVIPLDFKGNSTPEMRAAAREAGRAAIAAAGFRNAAAKANPCNPCEA